MMDAKQMLAIAQKVLGDETKKSVPVMGGVVVFSVEKHDIPKVRSGVPLYIVEWWVPMVPSRAQAMGKAEIMVGDDDAMFLRYSAVDEAFEDIVAGISG